MFTKKDLSRSAKYRREYYIRNRPKYEILKLEVQATILAEGGSLGNLDSWEITP